VQETASDETVIRKIVEANWATYCQMLDSEQLREVVQEASSGRDAQFESPKGGANFDVHTALQIVIQAASLVSLCLKIYNQLKQKEGNRPSAEKLKSTVVSKWTKSKDVKLLGRLDYVIDAVVASR
jgi:hypothetical protein